MKRYSTLIVEDEIGSLELMREYVSRYKELNHLEVATNGKDAFKKLKEEKFDLVFLDINLPVYSGLQIIEKIKYRPFFIITSGRNDKGIDSLNLGAIYYLLKPIYFDKFQQAVNKFLSSVKKIDETKVNLIHFLENRKNIFLNTEDILYLESRERHTIIHAMDNSYITKKNFKDFLVELPRSSFCRIHRNFIINCNNVKEIKHEGSGRYLILLNEDEDSQLICSRVYSKLMKENIKRNYKISKY